MDSEPFDVQHVKDSAGKGSPASAGKWALHEHGTGAKRGKKLVESGRPKGWKQARKGYTNNRDAFQRRLDDLVRSNPEVAARLARGMGK